MIDIKYYTIRDFLFLILVNLMMVLFDLIFNFSFAFLFGIHKKATYFSQI